MLRANRFAARAIHFQRDTLGLTNVEVIALQLPKQNKTTTANKDAVRLLRTNPKNKRHFVGVRPRPPQTTPFPDSFSCADRVPGDTCLSTNMHTLDSIVSLTPDPHCIAGC